ncbi:sucrose-6-phosphate hydrolase [Ligilactobacillus sp. WILCCON 0076]|uniref:Sucrose-6-phosphate hydrolase n=1 Tax=Ligilactobacillus ubinensis TaxID=2876789 RepID=A0A9X2JLX7_9LACO|nr:sucrose-6-phosphate hydrolase [Ligilactobacillus ubinensis]MCP0887085.1 sucrose-6-phosphate hydrolase [Ligilactobacillus ubinensis]
MALDNRLLRDLASNEKKLWYKEIEKIKNNSSLRQLFHIEAPIGFLGDPNGFSFFQGSWYLFHQWIPRKTKRKMVYWRGLRSKDLVHWESLPYTIDPDTKYDSDGVYSGSAWVDKGKLEFFYTGNVRNNDNEREAYQMRATLSENKISKEIIPAIKEPPHGYTMNFRDPKVWQQNGKNYVVIGAQTKEEKGCAIIYEASANLKKWQFKSVLQPFDHSIGYMWECPNFFELDGHQVFIFCPQGAEEKDLKYETQFPNAVVIGPKWTDNNLEWQLNKPKLSLIDEGFESYAAQIVQVESRTIIVSWMGPNKTILPTEALGWNGCLSLPRELSIQNGKLYQKPVQELKSLYGTKHVINFEQMAKFKTGLTSQFKVSFKGQGQVVWNLRAGNDNLGLLIKADLENNTLEVDRQSVFEKEINDRVKGDTSRKIKLELDNDELELEVWIDHTSFEIFIDQGKYILSGRIFTSEENQNCIFKINGPVEVKGTWHEIKY